MPLNYVFIYIYIEREREREREREASHHGMRYKTTSIRTLLAMYPVSQTIQIKYV